MQINSQLVARGAGGRGEALGIYIHETCLNKNYAITEFSNDFNPTNLSNPSSLQINSQLVAGGAGGRGEALGYIYIYIYITYIYIY